MVDVLDFLSDRFADNETTWSIDTFGAIAEFARDPEEAMELYRGEEGISVVTARGGLRITTHHKLRLIASESPTAESWSHRVAFCLPEEICAMNGLTELTEVGPDREALRAADRTGVLFDLGLGTLQIDVCVRTNDPEIIAALRRSTGKSVFAPESDAMSVILAAHPHRVFISRIGRAEVFQPIPPPGGKSPSGPHTHVLPKLLAHGHTHAATEPLPHGWIPCAHLYPPHPLRDRFGKLRPFRSDYHAAFQTLLERYGDPDLVALKRRVVNSIMAKRGPSAASLPSERFARATVRVALRQLQASEPWSPALTAWLSACDRIGVAYTEDPMEAPH